MRMLSLPIEALKQQVAVLAARRLQSSHGISALGLLAEIPILKKGERCDQGGLHDRLLVERHEGSLLNGIDLADELAQTITRRGWSQSWICILIVGQGPIQFLLNGCEHTPPRPD